MPPIAAATQLAELKQRLIEINDLESATAVLNWDQSTYMPPGGAPARARQIATLGQIAHRKFVDPAIGALLDELETATADLPFDDDDVSLLRVTRRDYERAVKLPAEFVAELYSHSAESFSAWTQARPADDFATMQPYLERTLELSRRAAEFFPGYTHIADPLIDWSDYGMQAATVRALFQDLREQLVPLVKQITDLPPADDACVRQFFPEAAQSAFGLDVVKRIGYDLERGRQDTTHHPFMTKFSLGDVRITTRYDEQNLVEGLFGTIHEAGHALYEQGIRREYEGLPLAGGTSSGVHESQSRLWENIVGRSMPFWEHFYPQLQAVFPEQLGRVAVETFYGAINRVERTLIRTEADEVTYNLHVIIRFDLELDLLEGKLAVRDLPEAWRARYQSDLGVAAPDDRNGVLQDVHWYGGLIGGSFQGYTIGNLLSAQFYESALAAHPGIPAEMARGEFGALHGWLRENVYQHGRKYTAPELVERATGKSLSSTAYIGYLRTKFGA